MVEYTPGTAQPLRKVLGAPRMLEQKLHICPRRILFIVFTNVEDEIGFRRHLLTLVSIG